MNLKLIISFCFIYSQINAILLKEISDFSGWRQNHLTGFGIVIGLNGTGDKSIETENKLAKYLKANGTFKDLSKFNSKNIASVMVTSSLMPFSKIGEPILADVSSIGNSNSLETGLLLLTPLKGVDGNIYAICQGKLSDVKTTTASLNQKCFIEKELNFTIKDKSNNNLILRNPNLNTAIKVEEAINKLYGIKVAEAQDNKNISLKKPFDISNLKFLSRVSELNIELDNQQTNQQPIITIDKINQNIVTSNNVQLKETVIITKDFSLKISSSKDLELGDTELGDGILINIDKGMIKSSKSELPYLGDVLKTLKILKVDFFDIVNIIKKLKQQGSFNAIIEEN